MIVAPLRSDIEITLQSETAVIIRDPLIQASYRFPMMALKVLQLADGKQTIDDIISQLFPNADLEQKRPQVAILINKAMTMGLLVGTEPTSKVPETKKIAKKNPLLITLVEHELSHKALKNLNILTFFLGSFKWLFFAFILGALTLLTLNFSEYWGMMQVYWQFSYWPETVVLIIFTLFWHESGHLAAAVKYGSKKAQAGIGLFLLIPVGYVKINDFRYIPTQAAKVKIAMAGSYFDLIIFSCCILVWHFSDAFSAINQISIVLSSILATRIVIDSIPFLRLDGYLALSEALNRPKLREQACALVMKRLPVVGKFWPEQPSEKGVYWLLIYGLLSIFVLIFSAVSIVNFWMTSVDKVFPSAPTFVGIILGITLGANLLLVLVRDILLSRKIKA